MSHEIRTPLNGVLGMAQALDRDDLTPVQRDRVRIIRSSGKALLAILNDVIDISRIEAGKLEIAYAPFDMAELIESACDGYRDVAVAKRIALTSQIDVAALGRFVGDPLRIRQILLNLISNALKFTDQGGVTLDVSGGPGGVVFSVTDQGVGIAPDQLPYLFEKFSQVDSSATRRFAGAGLGLAICRQLAGLMGGQMSVTSEVEVGSTFVLALPLARAPADTVSTHDPEPTSAVGLDAQIERRIRVLVAEDNETNRSVIEVLLEPLDLDIVLTCDGAEAVKAFRSEMFDVILMDVQMPIMNGIEATRLIRDIERQEARIPTPILALSANVMVHQVEEYAAAGMNGHIGKPIEVELLYAAISAALEAPSDTARTQADAA